MTRLWRVISAAFADEPLSTQGAWLFPGRWHAAGTRVLYCAQTESLARIERFVHLTEETGLDFVLLELALPPRARIEAIEDLDLPMRLAGWDDPESSVARSAGQWWIEHRDALGLSVPSVLSASERDIILRATSPAFAKLKVTSSTPFRFDPRMWRSAS